MIYNLLIFLTSYILIFYSIVGYGYLFTIIVNKKNSHSLNGNFEEYGINGIFGLVLLTIISYSTIIFFPHNYLHNSIILLFGLFLFIIYLAKIKKKIFLK